MELNLKSKFNVGDMVTYEYDNKYSETGQSRDTGPVQKIEYQQHRGFVYWLQGPNDEIWGGHDEYMLTLAPQGAVVGTKDV